MDEASLRQLVREVVARHVAAAPGTATDARVPLTVVRHPSHGRFDLVASSDGACIVEPGVRCTHCGFCQSMGH